jgi:anti-sigma factor RsiW
VTDHLDAMLSALLDGELTPHEVAAADIHLTGCAECRDELAVTDEARNLVRGLPQLDLPFGLIERTLALPKKRAARLPVLLAGAAAAVGIAFVALAPGQQRAVKPPVATFVDAHVTAASTGDPVSGLAPVAVPVSFSSFSGRP